uniref:Uncharacterized protein n=1 Tax=Panagrolaimus sp. PS1159 TaxID=55785 RepID=A0AC35GIS2_9BILA
MSGRAVAKGWAPTFIGYLMQGLGRFAASSEFFADMLLAPMEATNFRIQTSPT